MDNTILYSMIAAMALLFLLIIILFIRQSSLHKKYRSFMKGRGGKSIEELLKARIDDIDNLKENDSIINKDMRYLRKSVENSYQKCGIVKYDAFKEMGGKLSFSLALLNDQNSGFIFNSIHSREGTYTYIKEIIKGESYVALGDEEAEALEIAKQSAVTNLK